MAHEEDEAAAVPQNSEDVPPSEIHDQADVEEIDYSSEHGHSVLEESDIEMEQVDDYESDDIDGIEPDFMNDQLPNSAETILSENLHEEDVIDPVLESEYEEDVADLNFEYVSFFSIII